MWQIIEHLKVNSHRSSTNANYLQIWRSFNKFVIRLDTKPKSWEERVALYSAYLVQKGNKSSTVRSYISAIKAVLKNDGYEWNDNLILLGTLTRGCKLVNDRVRVRLPIKAGLLELILFEIERIFENQMYLEILYKAILLMGFYGLFRVGELAAYLNTDKSNHAIKAKDVHMGQNKNKILIVLFSSKTHGKESRPQKIKIAANQAEHGIKLAKTKHFCPFKVVTQYMDIRGGYDTDDEQFFLMNQKIPVRPENIRKVLKLTLDRLGLDSSLYNTQSLRIGRATEMEKTGYSIQEIKTVERWKSSTVFRYLRN